MFPVGNLVLANYFLYHLLFCW